MNIVWIVAGVAIAGATIAFAAWRRRGQHADLGAVSSQWIAEQRQSQGPNHPR